MTKSPAVAYVAPFLVFIGIMAAERAAGTASELALAVRSLAVLVTILLVSRPVLSIRLASPVASVALGAAVFLIWIGPDILFPYRHYWLFENAVTGIAQSSLAPALRHDTPFLLLRVTSSMLLVPVLEELFWRGWLMRWLIQHDWMNVPLGTYAASSVWIVALLFASEHGPYWEVGLIAGVLYNWWMVRTRSLSDCIVAHSVTNALLAAYVIARGQWQYWL